MMQHDFGEKKSEYSLRQKTKIPVSVNPRFYQARDKAIEMIESEKYGLENADFWILMNETKNEKMQYNGLILSHNGCLKINDNLPTEKQFKPECVTEDKNGYNNSLVFTYCCPEQGIYEVGEVSASNCKNSYPYAMAFKRLYDRVVLKNSKLAFAGVYGEDESDDFREPDHEPEPQPEHEGGDKPIDKPEPEPKPLTQQQKKNLWAAIKSAAKASELTNEDMRRVIEELFDCKCDDFTTLEYGKALHYIRGVIENAEKSNKKAG